MQSYFSTIFFSNTSLGICSPMAASTRISFYDKLEFEARNHYLVRSRSVQNVQRLPTRGVIFQPKYHQKSFISPSFVFHSEKARAGCTKEAYDKKWEVEEPKHKFSVYFPVLGTRDGLTENARYRLLISETPYTNPKPHDFRPLDDGLYRLRTLKTPDPTNLKLQIEGLSVINSDKGNALPQLKPSWDSGPFCTRKTPEPRFVPSLLFPKGRYSPAFRAHDAYLDRIAWSLNNKSQHNIAS